MSIETLFANTCVAKLRLSAGRIGTCLDKLSDDQIWSRGHENENSVGNLILHLAGNVRQWIVSGLGGEADTRVRELEFSTRGGIPAAALVEVLHNAVEQAAPVIESLTSEQLTRVYHIQNRQPTGLEAVLNVVEHFGQHTGQIIFATKHATGDDLGLSSPVPAK